eukprot:6192545-Pleurochrysis_carterae.AAC.2
MAHAATHCNVQPATYGQPMHDTDMDQQILDSLHLAKLGLPKTPWKFGITNNSSNDAQAATSEQVAEWKHPLDCGHKDNNHIREHKRFTGERWSTFCAGKRGSPGAPFAFAKLIMIITNDLQARGVDAGAGDVATAAATAAAAAEDGKETGRATQGGHGGRGGGRGSRGSLGRSAFTQVEHVPTAAEQSADPADLAAIQEMFGSRVQTLINILLAFYVYFKWFFHFKASIPLFCN